MKFILSFLVVVLLASGFFFIPKLIPIKSIGCASQFGPCSAEIEGKVKKYEGQNLYDAKRGISRELKAEDGVGKFTQHFKIPSVLGIYVIEKKSYIALTRQGLGKLYLFDAEGRFIEETESTNLPILVLEEGEVTTDRLSARHTLAAKILHGLFSLYEVKVARVLTDSLEADITTSTKVIFPLEGDGEVLLGSLNLIFSRLNTTQENSRIEIDLRYKNPVIR